MAIDRITRKIMEDAEAEVQEILAKADQDIERVKVDTTNMIREIEHEAQEDATKKAEEQKRRIISRAQAEMRKELLAEKQGLIDEAFQKALTAFVEMNEENCLYLLWKQPLSHSISKQIDRCILCCYDYVFHL